MDSYECQCNPSSIQCNKEEELLEQQIASTKQKLRGEVQNLSNKKEQLFVSSSSLIPNMRANAESNAKTAIDSLELSSINAKESNIEVDTTTVTNQSIDVNDNVNNSTIDDDYYYDDYTESDSDIIGDPNPSEISSTEITTKTIFSTTDDPVISRVFGRYMTVDTNKLLKKEQTEKNKQTKINSSYQNEEAFKKHYYFQRPLLQPQSPSLTDGIEVDILLPNSKTNKTEHVTSMRTDENDKNVDNNSNVQKEINEMSSEYDVMSYYSNEDVLATKELIDDMAKIIEHGTEIRRKQMSPKTRYLQESHGACFTGADRYECVSPLSLHLLNAPTYNIIISAIFITMMRKL